MKQVIILFLVSIFSFNVYAETNKTRQQDVLNIFKTSEPTAKDALWTADNIFKIGVIDNGQSRNGYASYACEILYDNGFKGVGVWVQVIDIIKLVNTNKWVKLGEARCK